MTEDKKHFFFHDYNDWLEKVKPHCEKNSVFIKDLHLQFRSHKCIMDVSDVDGIYLVRSVMGTIGQENTHYMTVGSIKGNECKKQMWVVPELIKEKEYTDTLDSCFDEAIIYNEKAKENRKEQIQT